MRSHAKTPSRSLSSGLVLFISLLVIFCSLGVLFVFEASVAESFNMVGHSYHFLKQHLLGLGLGSIAFLVSLITPPQVWLRWNKVLLFVSLLLLVLVLIPGIGLELNGARRWLSLGPLTFQPVEFAKFGVAVFFASWLSQHQRIAPFLSLTAVFSLLIMLQPDLGSLLVLGGIMCSMFFLAGGNLKHLAGAGLAITPILLILILTSPYRMNRLVTFFNPEVDPLGTSFHFRQITLALGRGGWGGEGVGNSRQRFSFIPEASTDSIFAIIAEEIGFLGSSVLICLWVAFFWLGYRLLFQAQISQEERLLGLGLLSWLCIQTILNLSAVVGLVPLTGIPLPFFSYGRTSQVMVLFAAGIITRLAKSR